MLLPNFQELVQIKNKSEEIYLHILKETMKDVGGHISQLRGRGMEFDKIRKYELGDDVRHIHWKITAKTGQPHIKTFIEEKQKEVMLFIDANENMNFGTKNTFKSIQAAKIASAIMWKSYKNGDKVGGCIFGNEHEKISLYKTKKSDLSILQILKKLSQNLPSQSKISLSSAIKNNIASIKKNSTIFIISDFIDMDENILEPLMMLRKKAEIIFVMTRDPLDAEMPNLKNIKLRHHAHKITLNDAKAVQNSYLEYFQNNEDILNDIMRKLKISKVEISTMDNMIPF